MTCKIAKNVEYRSIVLWNSMHVGGKCTHIAGEFSLIGASFFSVTLQKFCLSKGQYLQRKKIKKSFCNGWICSEKKRETNKCHLLSCHTSPPVCPEIKKETQSNIVPIQHRGSNAGIGETGWFRFQYWYWIRIFDFEHWFWYWLRLGRSIGVGFGIDSKRNQVLILILSWFRLWSWFSWIPCQESNRV